MSNMKNIRIYSNRVFLAIRLLFAEISVTITFRIKIKYMNNYVISFF